MECSERHRSNCPPSSDLNALISANALALIIDARGSNDDGVITGESQNKTTGATVAFVAVPKWK